MNHPHIAMGMRIVAATALALALPLSMLPAQAARPAPTTFTVNCVVSTDTFVNQAWVTNPPAGTGWVTYMFTAKAGTSIPGDPSAFGPSGYGVRPPTVLATGGGTVTATAWTAENGTELGTATGKCQVMRNQFAVKCAANTVEDGRDVAAVRNPPSRTGVVLYDFFADGVQVGSGYSFMVDRGAAVITPVGATSVTASAWTTTGIGDPPLLGDQIGETSADCT